MRLSAVAGSRLLAHCPANGVFSISFTFHLQLGALRCGCTVHRILHRFCEVILRHLEIVPGRNFRTVADLSWHVVQLESFEPVLC